SPPLVKFPSDYSSDLLAEFCFYGRLTMARKRNIISELLEKFSHHATRATGTSLAFVLAVGVIIVWGLTGPIFGYSDTWQLVINTGTTIITFLMVFLIQRAQNKDAL